MTTREFYESIGASYDNVLVRFGSEKMITKFAKRFADDTTFQNEIFYLPQKIEKAPVSHTIWVLFYQKPCSLSSFTIST